MKIKFENFFLLLLTIPTVLIAQEISDTKEQTEEEINNFREDHYCEVVHARGKFKGLENCAEGMTVWFITGYKGMENGELAVKFCDFSKTWRLY